MTSKKLSYDESSITGFTRDLEKIQAKPSLYIGPTDDAGIFTLIRECADNAVDEARAGRNRMVFIHAESATGPFWIADEGVGIPVKPHPKMKISTFTHVLTNLQSSGKMKSGVGYAAAVGTHGVGIKATNALSASFEAWTFRSDSKGWHSTRFAKGVEKQAVKKCEAPKVPGLGKRSLGTVIKFTPDPRFFGKSKVNVKDLVQWAELTSYMNSGLSITLSIKGKSKTWKAKNGVHDYMEAKLGRNHASLFGKKLIVHTSPTMQLILGFTDANDLGVEYFTNTVRNLEGGVHEDAIVRAMFNSLKPHMKVKPVKAKKSKSKKGSKSKASEFPFSAKALFDGVLGLVNYQIDAPQFDSQTKEKLVDGRVKEPCYNEALEVFTKFWDSNKSFTKSVIERATLLHSKTVDFLSDKNLLKQVGAARKSIVSKLAPTDSRTPVEERELFVVEGDSAGGGCKRARDKRYQAIFPQKGKPLNVLQHTKAKINANTEVTSLLAALDIDLSGKEQEPKPKYGKIIIMSDPDVDGKHIASLNLTLLWTYTPHLIRQGKVYVVRSPLYKCVYRDKVYFGMTKEEVSKQVKQPVEKLDLTYIKGWGEINEEDLNVALDPTLRVLYRVGAPSKDESRDFALLMGKDSGYRKKLLGVQ